MISTSSPRAYYTGDNTSTIFAVPFQFFAASDLKVYVTDPAAGTDVLKTLDSDYLVSGGAGSGSEAATGSIAFIAAPTSGFVITITMDMPQTQTLDIVDNDPFPAASVESALDRCVLIMQQVLDRVSRSLRQKQSDTSTIGFLPGKTDRASSFLAFDSDGDPIAANGGIDPAIPVSAFMETVLDDADATAARATLGVPDAAETLSNKSFKDTLTNFVNTSDVSKKFRLLLSSITTLTTRVWTVPDFSDTFLGLTGAQTPTNKTMDFGPSGTNVLRSTGANLGEVLVSDGAAASNWIGPLFRNFLINGNFDIWQRGTSFTGLANATSTYGPDRWYAKNLLGTNGVMRIDQTTGVTDGSKYGCQVKISTAPTAAQVNGCELYQTLENQDAIRLYNQNASFRVRVKALTNVTQVGLQFFYKTTEAKVDTAIGSEVLTTVNSSTFTDCVINGQALGTSQTASGVIGVRIRITGVSSGNTYDINNGFIVEQAMMNRGSKAAPFVRQCDSVGEELRACFRFYWASPTSVSKFPGYFDTTTKIFGLITFPVVMRSSPSAIVLLTGAVTDLGYARPGTSNASGASGFTSGTPNDRGSEFVFSGASASTTGFGTYVTTNNGSQLAADAEI